MSFALVVLGASVLLAGCSGAKTSHSSIRDGSLSWQDLDGDARLELLVSGRREDRGAAPAFADLRRLEVGRSGDSFEFTVTLGAAVPHRDAGWMWIELTIWTYPPMKVVAVLAGGYGSDPIIPAGEAYHVGFGHGAETKWSPPAIRLERVEMAVRDSVVRLTLPAKTVKRLELDRLLAALSEVRDGTASEAHDEAAELYGFELHTYYVPASVNPDKTEARRWCDNLVATTRLYSYGVPSGGLHPPLPPLR